MLRTVWGWNCGPRRFTAAAGEIPTLTLSDGMQPMLISEDAYAGKPNPHAWMSPQRAMVYVDRLQEAFTALDPDGAEQYAANAEAYRGQLARLDDELRRDLASIPEQHRLLVTCEGAFSYLANDYGLLPGMAVPVHLIVRVYSEGDLINEAPCGT